ncbi:UDP-glycosyltransferase [uncultured Polaribacter sp.]|uniref:UDP-glycosyltransferase n=1 Tax=uncultured Polaribacter sp. TaxID=174711 RepID=UPI0026353ABA|nr:UDP-glycosyltransferase [uncultured Polaribacter sp.]
MKKKILIFLPDGVGLRNFAFTDFYKKMSVENDVVFLNNTGFPLEEKLGIKEVKLNNLKTHFLTDLIKSAKNNIELKQNFKKYNNKAYLSYIFPRKSKTFKQFVKNIIINFYIIFYNYKKGVKKINNKINKLERSTETYKKSLLLLKNEKPDLVFCTNQRPILALSTILAAKDLKIPTATFIFSWDNLPKATLVVETDYYFVWSNFMKEELQKYYPSIKENQIKITGTPQFEPHFNKDLLKLKEDFFNEYKLDLNKKYICFSGDDVTTSPYDEYYLQDLAEIVQILNKEGYNLGIIYRKCPVDFTGREDEILKKYNDIIFPINPKWENLGSSWNKVMPLKEDFNLLANTLKNSILVINIGSSMVFDAVIHNVPCAYINYNNNSVNTKLWDINKIYKFIHFKSMPSKKAVLWVDKKSDFEKIIRNVLKNDSTILETQKWFNKITFFPQEKASENIINEINKILS